MGKKRRSFVVLGLGSFGRVIATSLVQFGNHVLGIDRSERRVTDLAEKLSNVAILDATDEAALREAGVASYDVALVSMGDNLESSILTSMNLRLMGVSTIWVKADNRTHHRILSKIGVDRVLLPDVEMGRHTAQMLNNPMVQDYASLGNGFSVVNIMIPERLNKMSIADLELGPIIRTLGLMRGTEYIPTHPDTIVQTKDRLLLLGRKPELSALNDTL